MPIFGKRSRYSLFTKNFLITREYGYLNIIVAKTSERCYPSRILCLVYSLNVANTQSMVISTKQKLAVLKSRTEQLNLHIHDKDHDGVQSIKYLGVHINNTLDWKKHTQEVSKKTSRSLGLITYAKRFLPLESLKNLYTGLVDPHFRYCCALWGVCGLREIQQLQKLQNRAARIIAGSNYDAPSKPLIKDLG